MGVLTRRGHAVVDLSLVFQLPPRVLREDRLPHDALTDLRERFTSVGVKIREGDEAAKKLVELRRLYEPYIAGLAGYFHIVIPPWYFAETAKNNWQVSVWDSAPAGAAERADHGGHF